MEEDDLTVEEQQTLQQIRGRKAKIVAGQLGQEAKRTRVWAARGGVGRLAIARRLDAWPRAIMR